MNDEKEYLVFLCLNCGEQVYNPNPVGDSIPLHDPKEDGELHMVDPVGFPAKLTKYPTADEAIAAAKAIKEKEAANGD